MHVANRILSLPDREQRGSVQNTAKVDGRIGAGQFDLQHVSFGEAFLQDELDDVERRVADGEGEVQIGLRGHDVLSPVQN